MFSSSSVKSTGKSRTPLLASLYPEPSRSSGGGTGARGAPAAKASAPPGRIQTNSLAMAHGTARAPHPSAGDAASSAAPEGRGACGTSAHAPVSPSKAQPWYAHCTRPVAVTRPSDKDARRCGHASCSATGGRSPERRVTQKSVSKSVTLVSALTSKSSAQPTGYHWFSHVAVSHSGGDLAKDGSDAFCATAWVEGTWRALALTHG
mmetsp:Transcript_99334/g.289896  ORF Transcript_99334/g.289896 Transcript_99334/m.289896 type:complete len:206 (+) Transcript_99334:827-1444(+)